LIGFNLFFHKSNLSFLKTVIFVLMRNTSVTQMAEPSQNCQINAKQLNTSGSVYVVKEELQVTEDLELKPIFEYNRVKMVAKRLLLSYQYDSETKLKWY